MADETNSPKPGAEKHKTAEAKKTASEQPSKAAIPKARRKGAPRQCSEPKNQTIMDGYTASED